MPVLMLWCYYLFEGLHNYTPPDVDVCVNWMTYCLYVFMDLGQQQR